MLDTVLARLDQGLRFIELRDDLLSHEELLWFGKRLPSDQVLLSLRTPISDHQSPRDLVQAVGPALLDVAQECCASPAALFASFAESSRFSGVISCHTRDDSLAVAAQLARLGASHPAKFLIKAALPIHSLAELWEGHKWHLQNPKRNLFLPIASDGQGRFRFYRLLRGERLLLNFLRDEATPIVADQPSPKEWSSRLEIPIPQAEPIPFAAIIGDPVEHSRTPSHHAAFFTRYDVPVLKVRLTETDLRSGDALSMLRDLGLRAAAVTSPHKPWLRDAVTKHSGRWDVIDSRDPQTAGNTLAFQADGSVIGATTDGVGLRHAWEDVLAHHHDRLATKTPSIAVFGGGGLLPLLQAVFPQAHFLSARTGLSRNQSAEVCSLSAISVLIWSVGRSRFLHNPPKALRPKLVFDLNYSADSPGRDYAREVGGIYVDGSAFFAAQADAQQKFWQRHLERPLLGVDDVDLRRRSP